jgi:anti-anti-sigma factor
VRTALEEESNEPFSVEVTHIGEPTTVVTVHGEVDIATLPVLADCLLRVVASGPERLVIDLADMGFLDCAGPRG